jgi:hypothetical protein
MKTSLPIFCLLLFFGQAEAQNISGHWFGSGKLQIPGNHDAYLSEIVIRQRGVQFYGQMQYYFRDSLLIEPIRGVFDKKKMTVKFNQIPIIYYGSKSTRQSVDCPMTGDFSLVVTSKDSLLVGKLRSTETFKYSCPNITFILKKSNDTILSAKVDYDALEPLPTEKEVVAANTISEDELRRREFEARKKRLVTELEVNSKIISLEFYDNGEVDYDSVSVFLNNKMIKGPTMLTHKAFRVYIPVDTTSEYTELSMYAENTGRIPPNTASIIIRDGLSRYELNLTSDMENTATIRFKRKRGDRP